MSDSNQRSAVVAGEWWRIGQPIVSRLIDCGYSVTICRRRGAQPVEESPPNSRVVDVDTNDVSAIEAFSSAVGTVDAFIHIGSFEPGVDWLSRLSEERYVRSWEYNVLELVRFLRTLIPRLSPGCGHIFLVGTEGHGGMSDWVYGVDQRRCIAETLRHELLDKGIRVTHIAAALLSQELYLQMRAQIEPEAQPAEDFTPITGDDVADSIAWSLTRPTHMDVESMVLRATAQAGTTTIRLSSDPPIVRPAREGGPAPNHPRVR